MTQSADPPPRPAATLAAEGPRRRLTAPLWLTVLFCFCEVLMMLGISVYPALLPEFQQLWGLSNGEAGWVGGIFYAGYVLTVPLLVALTDARDPRSIYLSAALVTALSCIGFALFAGGFWSAMAFRFLGGIGLAGSYMVGLRILTDRMSGRAQSRAIAFYTAHFAIGQGIGIWLIGLLGRHYHWTVSAWVSGAAALAVLALVWLLVAPDGGTRRGASLRRALDLRPALRNRRALGFTLAYACHGWELFAFRSGECFELRHGSIIAFGFFSQTGAIRLGFRMIRLISFASGLQIICMIIGRCSCSKSKHS